MIENKRLRLLVLVALLFSTVGTGFFIVNEYGNRNYEHRYEVKTEPITGVESDNVTDYEALTEADKKLLHEAFRRSDGFLSSASVVLKYDEEQDISLDSGFNIVSVEGATLLVSVDTERKRNGFVFENNGGNS